VNIHFLPLLTMSNFVPSIALMFQNVRLMLVISCVCVYIYIYYVLYIIIYNIKIKVKFSRYRPGVVQRLGRGIALLFHDGGTRRG
jgi:hypothetical protein